MSQSNKPTVQPRYSRPRITNLTDTGIGLKHKTMNSNARNKTHILFIFLLFIHSKTSIIWLLLNVKKICLNRGWFHYQVELYRVKQESGSTNGGGVILGGLSVGVHCTCGLLHNMLYTRYSSLKLVNTYLK